MVTEIVFKPIGTVHSPFKEPTGTPIQPGAAAEIQGRGGKSSRSTGKASPTWKVFPTSFCSTTFTWPRGLPSG